MKNTLKNKSLSQKYIFGVKAIADYLNVSERSVYIWEQELDFPLHRVADSNKRTVYASVDEIEKWLKNKPVSGAEKAKTKKRILWGSGFLAAIIVLILIWIFLLPKSPKIDFYTSSSPNPRSAVIEDKYIYIKDGTGEVIWAYIENDKPLDNELMSAESNLDFCDIDGDQANEVIAKEYDVETNRFYLTLFDNNGTRIWRESISNDQSFRGLLLRSNFFPVHSRFAQSHNKTFIITGWRHRTRFLVIITRYDINGNLLNEYIHTGHISFINCIDLNQDGTDEILFGATNNILNGEAVLAVLPLKEFKGVCPPNRIEPEFQHLKYLLQKYIADEAEPGNQTAYIRFKKINQFDEFTKTYIFTVFDHSDQNLFHIYVFPWHHDYENTYIGFEYVFSNTLQLMDIFPNSGLRRVYPRLCRQSGNNTSLHELTNIYAENIYGWDQDEWVSLDELELNFR
ncbi:MAG: hypothetical protein GF421_12650 [Candidatus Aminicenantes bacterium]|nr:hypothetical protein [Candidatus Aminicenantes bacterium]